MDLEKLQNVLTYIKQPSTWQGILLILGIFGVNADDQWVQVAGYLCGVAIGLISIFKDDGKGRKTESIPTGDNAK